MKYFTSFSLGPIKAFLCQNSKGNYYISSKFKKAKIYNTIEECLKESKDIQGLPILKMLQYGLKFFLFVSIGIIRHDLAAELYQSSAGGTSFKGNTINYNMVSIDGGDTWYLINEQRKIIGLVEDVYPGLLEHLQSLDAFIKHQISNKGEFDSKSSRLVSGITF